VNEECDRCGGPWGEDITCEDCTDDFGAARPQPIRRKLRVKRDANGKPIAEPAFTEPVPQREVDDAIVSIQTAVQNGVST
jgi:hypothetical protein